MALLLTWENKNPRPVNIEIYRSQTPLDRDNMPAPIKVITDPAAGSWIDSGAQMGETYYYILATVENRSRVFSVQRKIFVEHARGYGPNELIWGDESLGYYGEIPPGEFITMGDIFAAAKNTNGLNTTPASPSWHKFIRHNKIIYVANHCPSHATWLNLYNAGLVYGVDGPGPENMIGGLSPINQRCPVKFQGKTYLPRLLRGYWDKYEDLETVAVADNPTVTLNLPTNATMSLSGYTHHDQLPDTTPYCEWNDFIYSLHAYVQRKQRAPRSGNYGTAQYIGNAVTYYNPPNDGTSASNAQAFNQSRIWCQERLVGNPTVAGNGAITRGWTNGTIFSAVNSTPIKASTGMIGAVVPNPSYPLRWLPVLELEESLEVVSF